MSQTNVLKKVFQHPRGEVVAIIFRPTLPENKPTCRVDISFNCVTNDEVGHLIEILRDADTFFDKYAAAAHYLGYVEL